MRYKFNYSEAKNEILKQGRGVGFEEIIQAIESRNLIADNSNPNQKRYQDQRLFVVKINNYMYAVPYVVDHKRQVFFLKTLYPSRKFTKQYIKKYEKQKV